MERLVVLGIFEDQKTYSDSSWQIVRQLLDTSASSGPVADSVKMLSLRSKFSTLPKVRTR